MNLVQVTKTITIKGVTVQTADRVFVLIRRRSVVWSASTQTKPHIDHNWFNSVSSSILFGVPFSHIYYIYQWSRSVFATFLHTKLCIFPKPHNKYIYHSSRSHRSPVRYPLPLVIGRNINGAGFNLRTPIHRKDDYVQAINGASLGPVWFDERKTNNIEYKPRRLHSSVSSDPVWRVLLVHTWPSATTAICSGHQ